MDSLFLSLALSPINVIFGFFSILLLFAGLKVITSKLPVQAALYLVLAFVAASGLWVLLEAEFLAITLILVYVGAVMVLFLFVVMMLDLHHIPPVFKKTTALTGFVVAASMVSVVVIALNKHQLAISNGNMNQKTNILRDTNGINDNISNIKLLGGKLYTEYLFATEIASVILLAAIVVAVALTYRSRKDSKYTNPADQVKVKKSQRLKIVKM
jgi:NADH-quinone oxidoreductase subunit J